MRPGTAYVIGGGLAGLSAAVTLAGRGAAVTLIEGAAQAGGRCRSYFDPQLGLEIDNGNHLVLSGNKAVCEYLETIGGEAGLIGPDHPEFRFVDVRSGERWTVRPNLGPVPWWVGSAKRRVPDTRMSDYLALAALARPKPGSRVDETIRCEGALWDKLVEPLLLAALNIRPQEGSAELAGAVIRETMARGGRAYRPRLAHPTLAAVFVEPAVAFLESRGGTVQLGRRVRRLRADAGRAHALEFADQTVDLGPADSVVVALAPGPARELVPDLTTPDDFRAIVNGHFRVVPPPAVLGDDPVSMTGVIGGTVEWIFAFPDRISVTISGADRLVDMDRDALAKLMWVDVATAFGMAADLPPWQVVKERRATFAATPEQNALRPGPATSLSNVWLAGDWTDTGLPATLEGAVRSGKRAAELALA